MKQLKKSQIKSVRGGSACSGLRNAWIKSGNEKVLYNLRRNCKKIIIKK